MILAVPSPYPKWNGLDYSRAPQPPTARRRVMRGLGQDDDGGDDESILPIDVPVVTPIDFGTTPGGSTGGYTVPVSADNSILPVSVPTVSPIDFSTTPGTAAPASSSTGVTSSVISNLVNAGTQIGKTLAAEAAPAGSQLLYNSQGQLISATSLGTTLSSLTSGSNIDIFILIGLAALAFMALEKQH